MEPNIAFISALLGDPARSRMLIALMGGKALTATELALEADVTAQTASSHLAKLVNGELLIVRKQGRHKYFQLHRADIAQLIEQLLNVTSNINHPATITGPTDPNLRKARVCYDHLAGELSIGLYDALVSKGFIIDQGFETKLTNTGRSFFHAQGVNFDKLAKARRPVCKSCLDWSERRSHLAGSLGHWILEDIFAKKWAVRDLTSRAVSFNSKGLNAFARMYNIKNII
ncbi:ArsR/SmtB family transcription factor [Neptunicella marina]|uniref:Winged helix-turn-helix transcriptional regulator n=1 Tax=Neptunicella marina TaxID=2125989 RepID=A0A8J6IU63_9ALTE|nr:winged helix-turn-helix domain-containing protein [Neptunicella marina]MBC3765977.1 winged helix-turn-helix transcriptional regulator [Neptunicella marina]